MSQFSTTWITDLSEWQNDECDHMELTATITRGSTGQCLKRLGTEGLKYGLVKVFNLIKFQYSLKNRNI